MTSVTARSSLFFNEGHTPEFYKVTIIWFELFNRLFHLFAVVEGVLTFQNDRHMLHAFYSSVFDYHDDFDLTNFFEYNNVVN